ncbi:MAG: hypothetical protein GHCLOJNM_03759 [bacterium]|nr:hypothetical protein [bacterium]
MKRRLSALVSTSHARGYRAILATVMVFLLQSKVPTTAEIVVLEEGLDGYTGTEDTTLYSESENSNGGGKYLFSDRTAQLRDRRALIRFDLSGFPANGAVQRATLSLYVSLNAGNFGNVTHTLHRLRMSWGEGEVVAERPPPNESPGGAGAPAAPGDATWRSNLFGTSLWNQPGGDYEAVASATAEVGRLDTLAVWSGPRLAEDIALWLDSPESNHGWLLRGEEDVGQRAKRYTSSENSDPGARRPRLEIEYAALPGPFSGWMLK